MKVTTEPSCRVGWQGSTLRYVVKAEGATEVSVPDVEADKMQVRIVDQRTVSDGVEARLEVTVLDSTPY